MPRKGTTSGCSPAGCRWAHHGTIRALASPASRAWGGDRTDRAAPGRRLWTAPMPSSTSPERVSATGDGPRSARRSFATAGSFPHEAWPLASPARHAPPPVFISAPAEWDITARQLATRRPRARRPATTFLRTCAKSGKPRRSASRRSHARRHDPLRRRARARRRRPAQDVDAVPLFRRRTDGIGTAVCRGSIASIGSRWSGGSSKTDVTGPVNVTAPAPVTNREFARALGRHTAASRPARSGARVEADARRNGGAARAQRPARDPAVRALARVSFPHWRSIRRSEGYLVSRERDKGKGEKNQRIAGAPVRKFPPRTADESPPSHESITFA